MAHLKQTDLRKERGQALSPGAQNENRLAGWNAFPISIKMTVCIETV